MRTKIKSSIFIKRLLAIVLFVCVGTGLASSGEANIAVASNFAGTIKKLGNEFEVKTGHKIVFSFGSTGKHYAQIINGAPFDAFFAADEKRPALLETQNQVLPNSRFTYALGQLVLWSPDEDLIIDGPKIFHTQRFSHLAIANPKLAPYGLAAKQVLISLSFWSNLENKIVRGENAAQTYQFIKSGNSQLGFVPLAYVSSTNGSISGSYWVPDNLLYEKIKQQAVLLTKNTVALKFVKFVRSNRGRKIIRASGYGVSDVK